MAPVSNKRLILASFRKGPYVPGQTTTFDGSGTIDVDDVPLNGGVLLKTLSLSLEPYVLARMSEGNSTSFKIGEPISSTGVGYVVRSENPAFQVGDHCYAPFFPFTEYSIHTDVSGFSKIDNKHGLPWNVFVGMSGMPGQTAYAGWREHAHAKKGEVAFVSSGAGAVGSMVIQLAKRDGLKVIASAGSDDKVQYMRELGADVAFNYKTTKTAEVLEKEGPIDIYWDNVGGATLEAALNAAAHGARFIECGMISGYSGDAHPIPNLINVIVKEISINGFVIPSLLPKYLDEFKERVPALLASKELIYRESVTKGLENAETGFSDFLKGAALGKSVLVVAED